MTQVSMVGYAIAGIFANVAFYDLYYHLIAIMVLTGVLVREALSVSIETAPVDGSSVLAPADGERGN